MGFGGHVGEARKPSGRAAIVCALSKDFAYRAEKYSVGHQPRLCYYAG
jgi:hypothetical protein